MLKRLVVTCIRGRLQHRSQMFHEWALTWSPLEADYVTVPNYI